MKRLRALLALQLPAAFLARRTQREPSQRGSHPVAANASATRWVATDVGLARGMSHCRAGTSSRQLDQWTRLPRTLGAVTPCRTSATERWRNRPDAGRGPGGASSICVVFRRPTSRLTELSIRHLAENQLSFELPAFLSDSRERNRFMSRITAKPGRPMRTTAPGIGITL